MITYPPDLALNDFGYFTKPNLPLSNSTPWSRFKAVVLLVYSSLPRCLKVENIHWGS